MSFLAPKLLAVAALAAAPIAAAAQAQFSIHNPLVKPPSRGLAAAPATNAPNDGPPESARVPVARPVPDPAQPPWPGLATGGVPSQSADSAAKEELSAYTVVAIVSDAAVLRTNVGLATASPAPARGAAPGQEAALHPMGSAQPQALRQQSMRVRTGQPMIVAGMSVVPTVGTSTVEFRSQASKALLYTVSLDSQSPQAFVPVTREAADPAVAARAAPTPPNIAGITPAAAAHGTAGTTGVAGAMGAPR
jgi:hypothetical protein